MTGQWKVCEDHGKPHVYYHLIENHFWECFWFDEQLQWVVLGWIPDHYCGFSHDHIESFEQAVLVLLEKLGK